MINFQRQVNYGSRWYYNWIHLLSTFHNPKDLNIEFLYFNTLYQSLFATITTILYPTLNQVTNFSKSNCSNWNKASMNNSRHWWTSLNINKQFNCYKEPQVHGIFQLCMVFGCEFIAWVRRQKLRFELGLGEEYWRLVFTTLELTIDDEKPKNQPNLLSCC